LTSEKERMSEREERNNTLNRLLKKKQREKNKGEKEGRGEYVLMKTRKEKEGS